MIECLPENEGDYFFDFVKNILKKNWKYLILKRFKNSGKLINLEKTLHFSAWAEIFWLLPKFPTFKVNFPFEDTYVL